MQYSIKNILLISLISSLIIAFLTAVYLSSFGLDLSTFYIDLTSALITWLIIMPFIIKTIIFSK